jgi:uncharacterized protein (DUF362 family)
MLAWSIVHRVNHTQEHIFGKSCGASALPCQTPPVSCIIDAATSLRKGSIKAMSIVYWSKTDNRTAFVRTVLEAFAAEINGAQTFFVKVNLASSEAYPTTTHPQALRAVLEFLSGKDVVVGDAPAIDAGSSEKLIRGSALKQVCDSYGVPFVNLYKTKARKFVSPRGYSFRLLTLPQKKDWTISLPVLKSHNVCLMTGALKNQFGYLPRRERVLMHMGMKDIHKGIAELNVAVRPNLAIVDAGQCCVHAQEARHGGSVEDVGYMLASTDPVAVDCFGLEILQKVEPKLRGKSPYSIPHIRYALDYGVGSAGFQGEQITI